MSNLYMLVGVPGSGKTTWARSNIEALKAEIVSLEQWGFNKRAFRNHLDLCLKYKTNIIWDQTNLTKSARKRKLSDKRLLEYTKYAVYFPTPEADEWNERLIPKQLPWGMLTHMKDRLEPPAKDEDFDYIWHIVEGKTFERWD